MPMRSLRLGDNARPCSIFRWFRADVAPSPPEVATPRAIRHLVATLRAERIEHVRVRSDTIPNLSAECKTIEE